MLQPLYRFLSLSLLLCPLLAGAATQSATTQIADLKRIGNPKPADNAAFGKSVAGIGDVNGDGVGDLVIGAPGADTVYVISGKDQTVIRTISDPDGLSKYQFGWAVVDVGDWDQDGIDDFAVGAPGVAGVTPLPCTSTPCTPDPQWGRVLVFSGATGALLKEIHAPEATLEFGYAIAPLGDLNGDGKQALAVGAPVFGTGYGSVYAVSGSDGTEIWKATEPGINPSGPEVVASFGAALAVLRDINGDGKPDVLVGAPFHDDGTGKNAGAAYVLSGADGMQLRAHIPPQIIGNDQFGMSVTNAGDQNKDGVNDYIIGDPKNSKVYLFNGSDGTILNGIASKQLTDSFGFAAALVSDYDGDGVPDFFISAPDGDRIYLMNNAGTEVLDVPNPAPDTHSFGRALSATKDLGGDKGLDLLVGAPAEVSASGAAYLVTIRANQPPVANAGPDQTIECNRSGVVTLDGSASYDPDNDPITFAWVQVSGTPVTLVVSEATAQFPAAPPGVYEFQLTVTDDHGASSTDNVVITIKDTQPPVLRVGLTPNMLWPPNHKMIDISALIAVVDACDSNPTITLQSIVSNEPANGKGDGNTSPDIAGASYGIDDRAFQLRAERSGKGSGRVYTITYVAQDASGNATQQSNTVTVPHSYAGVSDASLTFGTIATGGKSQTKAMTIANGSDDALQISSISISGNNRSDFSETDNCVPGVAANSSCSINVTFKPTGSGSRAASMLISGDAANLPQQVALIGTGGEGGPDFVLRANPVNGTIKRGQSLNFALTVDPQGGFNAPVLFTCTGLPRGASCSFSPASVTPNGGPAATTLKVTTTAPSGVAARSIQHWLGMQGGALAAGLFLIWGLRRRKGSSWQNMLSGIVILFLAASFCVACGGGTAATSTGGATSVDGTPAGTSQITVTSTSGSGDAAIQHTVTLSLTVAE
ncbi:MAG: FG-GAP-like repeat-containing protein [Terracidiphilus sp.]